MAGRPGRPKIENLSVFHESAVPRTAGHNRGAISADAGGPDARRSDDDPDLSQTRETNRNDYFKHSEIHRRIAGPISLYPARAAAIPAT